MKFLLHALHKVRQRWRAGLPLRYTMSLVVVVAVSMPALVMLNVERRLTQDSQNVLLTQGKLALLAISTVSLAEPLWVVDEAALEAATQRILKNPHVVAVRIEERNSKTAAMTRLREGFKLDLDAPEATQNLDRHSAPVERMGQTLGTLTLWFDDAYGRGLLDERRTQMVILVSLQVLVALGVMVPVLVSRVLKPIERLKLQATSLLHHGPDAAHPHFVWKRNDEIGHLGGHLSEVQAELNTLFAQLGSKNAQLEQMALYDHLTALPNRTLFTDLVQREMLHARRAQQRFGILFIDLDRFKAVNDSLGHAAGDVLLVEVSQRLRHAVREVDVVCRQSGDEFLVLARDIGQWEALAEMADRILKAVEQPVVIGAANARVSASVGIAMFPDDADNFEDLVRNADTAMYQAKSLGRARYSFFHSELNARLQATLELEQELGYAIANDQLVLHYQPQVDANSGDLVGVEALVRWQHPQRGLLYPGAFIAMAEESGRIAEMGAWTLRTACRQMAQWKARGMDVGVMAVNVSALEFRDHRLLESLHAALAESGMHPKDLEIEITESVLMAETETSQRIIERLRELGVGIAIDDFGTGYSSLAYLKRLKPNQLKIDRSFVSDTTADSDSRAIVRGIVGLANALGLTVVAEGVETADQMLFLRETGCQTLQGYYLAKPLPVDQLEQWLAARDTGAHLFA